MSKKSTLPNLAFMARLFGAIGPSGSEMPAAKIAAAEFKRYGTDPLTDGLGSFVVKIGKSPKNAPKVLVLSHIDEVGFVVRGITAAGGLKLIPVGGIDHVTLFGQRIKLQTRTGAVLHGAFHYSAAAFEQRKAPSKVSDLVADFGFADKKQAERKVHIGDPVVFDSPMQATANGRFLAKAVDDRMGVLALIGVAKKLMNAELNVDLRIGFSVQEEVGTRGGKTMASALRPDFAVICDVSNALDAGGSKEIGCLGGGVQFRPMDAGTIQSAAVSHWYLGLLKRHKIPNQPYISPGATDAREVHLSGSGVPTLQIGLVAREIHSASTMFDMSDLEAAVKAITVVVQDLDQKKIGEFKRQ